LKNSKKSIDILAYCLMPTHFHLLIRQVTDTGISHFLSQIQNAFTRYFNIKYQRKGPLFIHTYSAVTIAGDDQLKHILRYIHLNPYSSNIVNLKSDILTYPWSSCTTYLADKSTDGILNTQVGMSMFNYKKERFITFMLDHADYQKQLEYCKHAYRWEQRG